MNDMLDYFLAAARNEAPPRVPVVIGTDSTFVPSAFDMNTLDYFMYPQRWLSAHLTLRARFPDILFLPDFWVEYGMANEASAFGASVMWRHDQAPAIRPVSLPPEKWHTLPHPDPYADGMMAFVLRRYWNLEQRSLLPDPHRIHFVAARGPFTLAAHVVGSAAFMAAVGDEPNSTRDVLDILDIMTETAIRFLQAQLGFLREPLGVFVLDDTVGLLSASQFNRLAIPFMNRVFDAFDGLVRVYHNKTPCHHLLPHMHALNFDVWHLSHQMHMAEVRDTLPNRALMGNIAPLGLMVHATPQEVEYAARDVIEQVGRRGLILAPGGNTHAHTPADNLDALVRATLD